MSKIKWDQVGERKYETGVDHGVLYLPNPQGVYATGVAWNGLTMVGETPTGGEATPFYADNIKYLNLVSREEFEASLEAMTYPKEFEVCEGSASPVPGVTIGQQSRRTFGLSYRTLIGNDVTADLGYKIHLIYGALATPTEKSYNTINDTPEPIMFSWSMTTTPVEVPNFKPTASWSSTRRRSPPPSLRRSRRSSTAATIAPPRPVRRRSPLRRRSSRASPARRGLHPPRRGLTHNGRETRECLL